MLKKITILFDMAKELVKEKNTYNDYEYVIYSNKFDTLIKQIDLEHRLEIAELEAKVYTYEKIIANSNFAPILKENKKTKKGN